MSGHVGLIPAEGPPSPSAPPAELHMDINNPQDGDGLEEKREITDEEEEEEEEEEEMISSAHLEPSTLPWPGDKRPQTPNGHGVWSEKIVSEPEETDEGSKAKWRESMPEGERWRDDDSELQKQDKGDGSMADDEDEDEEEDEEGKSYWISEKSALGFTPRVTIVRRQSFRELSESSVLIDKEGKEEQEEQEEPQMEAQSDGGQFEPEWRAEDEKFYLCEHLCSEKVKMALAVVSAGILFPLLVWGGYVFLPFDTPVVVGTPLRVVYTLRCSFFAVIPILLGMLVLGAVRLRHNNLKPLYLIQLVDREVAVQRHYVNDSLAIFLFFFLQLAVMATYISQDLVKLVPLLTIIFVFGRLIYWLCLSLGAGAIRSFGFGLSFLPILVMLGANLYFVCMSFGQDAIFQVEPPTTAPPPRMRWWG